MIHSKGKLNAWPHQLVSGIRLNCVDWNPMECQEFLMNRVKPVDRVDMTGRGTKY